MYLKKDIFVRKLYILLFISCWGFEDLGQDDWSKENQNTAISAESQDTLISDLKCVQEYESDLVITGTP